MVKSEIIKQLHLKYPSLKRYQITKIVDLVFNNISDNLVKNKPIELRSFGRCSIKLIKDKHNARNPKTGEIIYVPVKKKVSFKMSKHLKEEINKK